MFLSAQSITILLVVFGCSHIGECPHLSIQCNSEFGNASLNASPTFGGVTLSFLPHIIQKGILKVGKSFDILCLIADFAKANNLIADSLLLAIANTFLENQRKMANFSKSYDVDFYTVLQPFTHLHDIPSDLVDYSDPNKEIKYKNNKGDYYSLFAVTYNPQDDIEYEPLLLDYVQEYYKYIIDTEFCENYCIDATNIFEGEGDNLSDFMIDSIHLTDLGVNVMVENLLQDVNFQK